MVLACSACSEQPEWWWEGEADFEWRGDHVTISGYGREEVDACGSSFIATDEYVSALVDFHGVDAPVHVDYDWFSEARWAEMLPCRDVYACTGAGRIVTRNLVHAHELGHAVSWDIGLNCPSMIEEGLAEYLGEPKPAVFDHYEFSNEIEDVLLTDESDLYQLPSEDYRQAGHFVAFLIEDYGIEATRGLCERIPYDADLADWEAATQSVLSMPLADVLADYSAYPICQHHGYRARLTECGGSPDVMVDPDAEETTFSLRIGCDEPDAIGERDGLIRVVRRVHAEQPGWYDIGIDGGEGVTLVLEQCAACSEEPYVAEVEGPIIPDTEGSACTWVESPRECGYRELSGTHAFIFFLAADQQREVTVRIRPTGLDLD